MKLLDHGDSRLLAWLKVHFAYALHKVLAQPKQALAAGGVALLAALAAVPFFPTAFLPPFNEGTLLVRRALTPAWRRPKRPPWRGRLKC